MEESAPGVQQTCPTPGIEPASPTSAGPLNTTGFLLSRAGRVVRERFQRALAPTGLHARHLGVLLVLREGGPLPQGEAARRQGLDKSTLVAIVDELEGMGLVERRRNPADRRAYALTLTAAGRERLAATIPMIEGTSDWLAPLDAAEQAHLHALLRRLLYGEGGWLAVDTPDNE